MALQDTLQAAKAHSIRRDTAAPDFFEGALMGNGSLGAVVCTRPDALVIHFGHNDIWDIRIEEGHKDCVGTFDEIWGRIQAAPGDVHREKWYQEYVEKVTASYHDHVYPRPYPASSLYLFFDRKEYEVLGQETDISTGLFTAALLSSNGEKRYIQAVMDMDKDAVCVRTVDEDGREARIFSRLWIRPHRPDGGLPGYTLLPRGFIQPLPYNGCEGHIRPGVDKGFSVCWRSDGEEGKGLDTPLSGRGGITLQIRHGYYDRVAAFPGAEELSFDEVAERTKRAWEAYWSLSGVSLEDKELERIWYVNSYFIRCLLSPASRCPGLFGCWMLDDIGTAWHGDYHMNYNTQQVFWGLMAANRADLHMPYLRMVEDLMPVSRAWAHDFYRLEGACFPHSAYPVPMTVMPYPSPDWGWEIFETPWTVQSLWWHYTYTGDRALLRDRIYPVLRAAAAFLVGYMTRPGADPVGDGKYHLFPTIVPELYGLTERFRLNLDGAVDLALTKFVLHALLTAIRDLGMEEKEAELSASARRILDHFPDYPTALGRFGEVYVSTANEDPDRVIYNCPANLMQIFPGEDVDALTAGEDDMALAENSWRHHYNEGGNDLVFYHLIGARLGCIDLEAFKRHVRYCAMPNGACADRVTLTGGRYPDDVDVDFMSRMGIWVENFSLYAVVDECLMWGHGDIIKVFPCWDLHKKASFHSLRARGALLVDAACEGGMVNYIRIKSEKGNMVQVYNPWPEAVDQNGRIYTDPVIRAQPLPGHSMLFTEKR